MVLGDNLRSARHAAFRCNHHFLVGEQRRAIEFGEAGLRLARECGDGPVEGQFSIASDKVTMRSATIDRPSRYLKVASSLPSLDVEGTVSS